MREIAQSGLNPSNCRLLDAAESELTHAGPPGKALLVLGFESAHHPVDASMDVALAAAHEHGGEPGEVAHKSGPSPGDADAGAGARPSMTSRARAGAEQSPVDAWRHAFLAAPYLRDNFIALGVLSDTFETAITWDRFEAFHRTVMETARAAVGEPSRLSCRFTHVYPDGPAPYYTVLAPARRGSEVEQWDEIKAAASEAMIAAGGTITHHHAVGRDHRPWYDRQRPDPFARALRSAKHELDPAGTLNPGVLVDP